MSLPESDDREGRVQRCLLAPLALLRRRCRFYLLLEGLVPLGIGVLGGALVQLALDRWLGLSVDQRATINLLLSALWLWLIYRFAVRPLLSPLPDALLAAAVDRAEPGLHDQLASAVQFASGAIGSPQANSPRLMEAVVREACESAARLRFLDVLNHRRARQRATEIGVLVIVAVAPFFIMPDLMQSWFKRNWLLADIPWHDATYLLPIGFESGPQRRFPRGDELRIAAENRGPVPKSATLHWWTPSGRKGRQTMTLVRAVRWEASLGLLTEDVYFRLTGGSARTGTYHVVAVDRPRILRTTARITPPAYTGAEPETSQQQTVIELLRGSRLEIEAELNKPIRRAQFTGTAGAVGAVERVDPTRIVMRWDQPTPGVYAFELEGADGFSNRRPVQFTLKVKPDLPPTVRLDLSGAATAITPRARLDLSLRFEDRYGLSAVSLLAQRNEEPPVSLDLEGFRPHQREFETQAIFAAETLALEPGQRLRLWAEARDTDPSGPNAGRSDVVELRVLSATDFLTSLAEREQTLRQEFERLVSTQRGLNDAVARLLPTLPSDQTPDARQAQQIAGLTRRQEAIARRVDAIRRQFEQILEQMEANQVGRLPDLRRIAERVIEPLHGIGRQRLPEVARRLSDLRREASSEGQREVPAEQAAAVRDMEQVLANMLEWEGYREAVALLTEIIEMHKDVRRDTAEALESQVESILGPGFPEGDSPSQSSNP